MSYSQAKQEHEQSGGRPEARTDYRCKAHGCPNAGSIDDLCFWHYREADPALWPGLTHRIRMNFDKMRNWDNRSRV
jgi:hypothetical protein